MNNNDNLDEKKLELTWNWFEFHADQRLRAFYYFLLIMGALSWGYLQCFQGCQQVQNLVPFISILGIFVSWAFLFTEIRNVELVNIGRKTLCEFGFRPSLIDSDRGKDLLYKEIRDEIFTESAGWLKIFKTYVKLEFWLRYIYIITFLLSLGSLFYYMKTAKPSFPAYIMYLVLLIIFILYAVFRPCGKRE